MKQTQTNTNGILTSGGGSLTNEVQHLSSVRRITGRTGFAILTEGKLRLAPIYAREPIKRGLRLANLISTAEDEDTIRLYGNLS